MKPLLLIAGFIAVVSSASAQTTITQTRAFGPSVMNFDNTYTFNQYNGDLTDIVSVTWSYSLSVSGGQAVLDNDGVNPATAEVLFGGELEISSDLHLLDPSFGFIFANASATTSGSLSLAEDQGDGLAVLALTGPDTGTLLGQTAVSSNEKGVATNFWNEYAGAGTVALDVSAKTLLSIDTAGGISSAFTPGTAEGTITLTIVVVPEPSSVLLSMSGLLVICLRRRR